MKVLFVSNLFPDRREPYRGLDNVTVLHHLRQLGHEIRVICPRPVLRLGGPDWVSREEDEVLRPIYLKTPYVPKVGGLFNHRLMGARLRPAMAKVWKEWKWDLVLGSWLFPDGWSITRAVARSAWESPVVLIAQGSDVHRYLHSGPRRKAILEACGSAQTIITRSRSLATLLAGAGVQETKLKPIHNGVDPTVFNPGDPTRARHELGIEEGGRWLLFVGNLLPVKDPVFLLEAFRRLKPGVDGAELQLAIAGRGPMRAELEQLAKRLGIAERVRFLGPLESQQVATWMRAADLLVMTSRNEGLPNVILESQACGLPVVSTDVGGIHELVDEPWKGRLTPLGEMDAWVAAVEAGLVSAASSREMLAAAGRPWSFAVAAYDQILQLALAQASKLRQKESDG